VPKLSVVIATRDRPALFAAALGSVLAQTETDLELVTVDDGSAEVHRAAYASALASAIGSLGGRTLRSFALVRRPRGHGPSYALNFGVSQSLGDFVCFLDDDDLWVDRGHLARARSAIDSRAAAGEPVDLYMTNQEAYRGGEPIPGPIWLESLAGICAARGEAPDAQGCLQVGIADLLAANGFCHLNCLVVRRDLYESVGGMDEEIRWEGDRDLFYRLIDRAGTMLHHPGVVARHHVPQAGAGLNVTTGSTMLEKRLYQLRLTDRAALFARSPLIRARGRSDKVATLKKIAEELAARRDWRSAAFYAREALAARPSPKWLGFAAFCQLRHWLKPSAP
jgi:glycosyltransferase involved in cell wall biosynthesis